MILVVGLLQGRQTLFFAVLIESILRVNSAVESAFGRLDFSAVVLKWISVAVRLLKSARCGQMEEDMRNSRTMIVLAGLVLLVAMVPAFAQTTGFMGYDVQVKFKAPMAFYAGDKLLPAGDYTITQTGGSAAQRHPDQGQRQE